MSTTYRVAKGQRSTPCCGQPIRVKIIEKDSVQSRRCELCHRVNWFVLEEYRAIPGTLRVKWIDAKEAEALTSTPDATLSGLSVDDLIRDATR